MYFLLFTNYSNYIVFDKALTLLDQPKKTIAKTTKRVRSLKQSLKNLPFKMLVTLNFVHIASSTVVNDAITSKIDCLPTNLSKQF